jgi:hypothetical protein
MSMTARLKVIAALAVAVVALTACSSSADKGDTNATASTSAADAKDCRAAMQNYSVAVATIPGVDEKPYQTYTLSSCTRDEWLEAIKPYSAPSRDVAQPGDIVTGAPEKFLESLCKDRKPTPKACD